MSSTILRVQYCAFSSNLKLTGTFAIFDMLWSFKVLFSVIWFAQGQFFITWWSRFTHLMFINHCPFLNSNRSSPESLKQGWVPKPCRAYQCTGIMNNTVQNGWTIPLILSSHLIYTTAITIAPSLPITITPSQNLIIKTAGFTTPFSRNF